MLRTRVTDLVAFALSCTCSLLLRRVEILVLLCSKRSMISLGSAGFGGFTKQDGIHDTLRHVQGTGYMTRFTVQRGVGNET